MKIFICWKCEKIEFHKHRTNAHITGFINVMNLTCELLDFQVKFDPDKRWAVWRHHNAFIIDWVFMPRKITQLIKHLRADVGIFSTWKWKISLLKMWKIFFDELEKFPSLIMSKKVFDFSLLKKKKKKRKSKIKRRKFYFKNEKNTRVCVFLFLGKRNYAPRKLAAKMYIKIKRMKLSHSKTKAEENTEMNWKLNKFNIKQKKAKSKKLNFFKSHLKLLLLLLQLVIFWHEHRANEMKWWRRRICNLMHTRRNEQHFLSHSHPTATAAVSFQLMKKRLWKKV